MSKDLIEGLKKVAENLVGTIWGIPDRIWTTGFAHNKPGYDFHPGLVWKVRKDGITARLVPGTSQDFNIGSCVFKTRLTPFSRKSYFLIKLSMPILIEDLKQCPKGWNNTETLSSRQMKELSQQIGFCKGASVAS